MATVKIDSKGLEDYMLTLKTLTKETDEIIKRAVFEGSKAVADAVKINVENLPVDDKWGTEKKKKHGVTKIEKKGLAESLGISQMQNDKGYINTLIGFCGYNDRRKANILIARATQSGTSFSDKIPFFDNAVRSSKMAAKKAMEEEFKREIKRLLKEKGAD